MSLFADTSPFRPLGLGEMFDRAITVYVRNFVAFSAILLALLIPISVAEYASVANQHQGASLAAVLQQIQHPEKSHGKTPPPTVPFSPWLLGVVVLSLFLTPFANVAVAAAVAAVYFGKAIDWRACYRAAFARWPAILVLTLLQMATLGAFIFGLGITVGIVSFLGIFAFAASPVLGAVVFVFAGLLFIAWMLALMLAVLAIFFAFDSLVIEQTDIGTAFSSGFTRIFARTELGKAALVGLSLLAIEFGILILITGVQALTLLFVKSEALSVLLASLVSLISTAFTAVLVAVYYFDVRVRREGLDMQIGLQQIASDASVVG
ncbi:MAG: hypothetical protein M3Y21_05010 [Candidatus Eremiobacteraeota bacterium]|nr:hypothetical protein [Candidatus Eremiobacteraeota bacterium]